MAQPQPTITPPFGPRPKTPVSSIPDWLRSIFNRETNWVATAKDPNQASLSSRQTSTGGTPTPVGGFAQRVQDLMNAGYDYDQAIEMASAELDNQQFYADLLGGGTGGGTAAAQITADAQRDVARMQVDADKYTADLTYRAAVDVAASQVDSNKYVADMAYRQAVDAALINADASRDVQRMDVDARRYEADSSYRQAVDVAQIGAYTDRMLGLGEIGLGYYKTLAEMQKNPADWVSYWYATQGQKLPEDYAGAGIPEGLQLPGWLQSLNEAAGYEPTTWEAPVPELGAAPEMLGPPQWEPITAEGARYERATPGERAALARATPGELAGLTRGGGQRQPTSGESAALGRATPEELAALGRATPEELARLWRGGQTPSMSGGGRMTIREPAGIIGLHSGRTYATLAEEAPEEVSIKSQKNTAQEQGTQSYGGTGEDPRSFASGGQVRAYDPSGFQSKRAGSAASQHYGRQRKAHGGLSGYGPATEAAWETTPDTYTFNSETGVGSVAGDTSGTDVAAATAAGPTMPPWLKTLSEGGRQQYPAANLAGLPPAPSAQYMRGTSESQFQGLQGVVQKAGGYIPDWLKMIAWLMPQGNQFSRPTSMAQKY